MSGPPQVAEVARSSTAVPSVSPPARDAILAWYGTHGRALAFRRTTDPYAVLVSEAMAQQTQAARAAEHWERWLIRFPTVEVLAAASPAEVLRAWAGLGYDRRGLALWRAARVIVADHGGVVPADPAVLQTLPGIGPYTARAVAAIAYGRPVGAVDVNVRRVVGRIVAGSADGLAGRKLQAVADASVPPAAAAAWTHAVMDLGATICRPRAPRCEVCPARAWCRAATRGHTGGIADPDAGRAAESGRERSSRRPAVAFPTTNRWLRGRILDRLRAADGDAWVPLDGPIGEHPPDRVAAAARRMAADGVLELDEAPATLRARLPLA